MKFDMFVMDVLTPIIHFELGSLALHLSGYEYIGHIAGSRREDIEGLKYMTPWKMKRIEGFLRRHELTFGTDIAEWRRVREQRDHLSEIEETPMFLVDLNLYIAEL